MAVQSEIVSRRLQLRLRDEDANGNAKFKNISFANLKTDVAANDVFLVGTQLASLQSKPLNRVAVTETVVYTESM